MPDILAEIRAHRSLEDWALDRARELAAVEPQGLRTLEIKQALQEAFDAGARYEHLVCHRGGKEGRQNG